LQVRKAVTTLPTNVQTRQWRMEYQDTRGRLTKVTDANGHTSLYQEYDQANNLKQMTDASGAVTGYAYDPANRLQTVTLNGGASVGYQWEADGLLKRITYSANQSRNYAYDNADRVQTITNTVGSRSEQYSYGYDAHSNRLSEELKTDGSATALRRVDYEYDFGDRLKKATTGSQVTQWNYDGAGNRLSETVTVGGTNSSSKTYSYDSLNRLRNVNGTTFEYDANGNLTTQTAGLNVTSYEYDARDQMRRVLNGANEQAQYDYDYERRRIGKTLNQGLSWREYVYDGSQVSAEYGRGLAENGGMQRDLLARYDYGTDLIRGEFGATTQTSLWYYSDALGSVTALSNSSGTIQTAYGYNAWGERTVGSDWGGAGSPLNNLNAVGYTGQFFDNETGLQPLGNGERYYNPALGRFTQQDSFSGVLGEAASLNRYSYVYNNPNKYTDPSGHYAGVDDAIAFFGGAAIGALADLGHQVVNNIETGKKWNDIKWNEVGESAAIGGGLGLAALYFPVTAAVVGVGLTGYGAYTAYQEYKSGQPLTALYDATVLVLMVAHGLKGKAGPERVVEKPRTPEVGKEPMQPELPGMEGHRQGQMELPGMEGHRVGGVGEVIEPIATDHSRQRRLPFEGAEPEQLELDFRNRGEVLREKYNLSENDRQARIDELTRVNYERVVKERIDRQDNVYRYLSESGYQDSLKYGSVRGYTTTQYSNSSLEVARGNQILAKWGVPKYRVTIPKSKLSGSRIARPFGNKAKRGWEVFTNSYPEGGPGGWLQFLLDPVPIQDVVIDPIEIK
jgi:RHS repeat-associated protein